MFSACPAPDHPFFAIAEKYRRDQIWSVLGPPLLRNSASCDPAQWLPDDAFRQLASCQSPAPDFTSPRLGFMFETLWQDALTTFGLPHLSNLQIQQNGRTLGELDLILQQSDPAQHIELALKFYLGIGSDWVGPNLRDLLSRKIRHTFDHQLPLASAPAARAVLDAKGIHRCDSAALMRGCLFHPTHGLTPAPLPAEVSPHHWRGYWCPVGDAGSCLPEGRWYVLSKPDWLSPVLAKFSVSRADLLQYLASYFRHLSTPISIALVMEGPYGWAEHQRWMIVSDHWLD